MRTFLALALVVIAACGGNAPVGAPAPDGAKPLSGTLVIYSSIFTDAQEALKAGFEKANPQTKVEFLNPGGTEAIIKKLVAEKADPKADIMHSGFSLEYQLAKKEGLLQVVDPKDIFGGIADTLKIGGVDVPLKDKENMYFAFGIQWGGLEINTDRMKALNLPTPKALTDLTDARYKGHVGFMKPQNSSTAFTNVMYTYHALGNDEAKFRDYWAKLNTNIAFYTEKSSTLYSLVAKGEVPIGIVGSRAVYRDQMDGQKVEFIYPSDGSVVLDNTMGLVKGAKNRELAVAFMRFHFSAEGQKIMADASLMPVRPGITASRPEATLEWATKNIPKVIVPDPAIAEAKRADILKLFDGYTQGRSK